MSQTPSAYVLPDGGILLHVGPHKTGTTAIQGALASARPLLKSQGILYPGSRVEHNKQAAAAIQRALGWEHNRIDRSRWSALADAAKASDGRSVISSEVFCEATQQAAQGVVDDLDPDRVQVVVTLRPLEKLLPSNWQQYIKSGYRVSYEQWLENVLSSREKRPITPSFWIRNNHPAVIERWAAAAGGPEKVTVVIVDAAKPRSLFDSFEDLLRLERGTLNADKSGPSNRSLSGYEVELLRHLNARARSVVSYEDYYRFVKRGAVLRLVEGRKPDADEPRVTTPGWAIEQAREYSCSDVAAIHALGVHVLGDLDTLAPSTPVTSHEDAEAPSMVPVELAARFMYDLLDAGIAASDLARREATAAAAAKAELPVIAPPEVVGFKAGRAVARLRGRARRLLASLAGDRMPPAP